ncbi:KilA-N domain-containing protein [Citrobacter farmeri]|uniref:KilA-N domain-containing protein n=1 Tax=Citrobacter farmeri TaxID=67824 RepID=UPI002A822FF8|nr:KilA-N domain-containing protein [Citrobacter farmeri]
MNPVDFIRKNIAAQLAVEGFPEQVCQGGGWSALTTTAGCRRQPAKAGHMTIVFTTRANGLKDRRLQRSARQRKSREEKWLRPACSNLPAYLWNNTARNHSMKNNINKHPNVSSVNAESLPVIAGVEITTDAAGRFSLNCLHRASGESDNKAPNQWLRTKQAKELIAELESKLLKKFQTAYLQSAQKVIDVVNGGTSPGTYAHELIAVSYAGWISADFQLDVNQTFIDFRTGKLAPVSSSLPDFNDPAASARAWADEYEAKNKAITYVHRQAQYIEHLENLFQPGMSPCQFCKQLNGVNVQQVNAFLSEHSWLYDDQPKAKYPRWRVHHYARDLYLSERSGQVEQDDGERRDTFKPILLRKGAVWIYRHYLKGHLPMKKSWKGEFTHDKELAGAA